MKDNKSAYNAHIYDENIVNTLPYYKEYSAQIIDLVNATGKKDITWLDTGCGTGTLAVRVLSERADVSFSLCDPSEQMLEIAKNKLSGLEVKENDNKEIKYFNISSGDISFSGEFDVVTAVQSHHYLTVEERKKAVKNCYNALKDGGIFVAFENIRMTTDESDELTLKRWVHFLEEHGNSPEKVQMQLDRRGTEVLPITVEQHIEILRECGFRSVNVLWASYLQAGVWGIK